MTVSQDHRIIAMWSGPRNVSTALMYSFAQRQDCVVWDEPYYAAWLAKLAKITPCETPFGRDIQCRGTGA